MEEICWSYHLIRGVIRVQLARQNGKKGKNGLGSGVEKKISQKFKEQCLYRSVPRISGKQQIPAGLLWRDVTVADERWGMLEGSASYA